MSYRTNELSFPNVLAPRPRGRRCCLRILLCGSTFRVRWHSVEALTNHRLDCMHRCYRTSMLPREPPAIATINTPWIFRWFSSSSMPSITITNQLSLFSPVDLLVNHQSSVCCTQAIDNTCWFCTWPATTWCILSANCTHAFSMYISV